MQALADRRPGIHDDDGLCMVCVQLKAILMEVLVRDSIIARDMLALEGRFQPVEVALQRRFVLPVEVFVQVVCDCGHIPVGIEGVFKANHNAGQKRRHQRR